MAGVVLLACLAPPVRGAPARDCDTLRVFAVGDIMLGTSYPDTTWLPPSDGARLLDPVKASLRGADVLVGNCEGAFLDQGAPSKDCGRSRRCYVFRQPTRYARYLAEAGFDVLSLANNHAGDFGPEGRTSTLRTLDRAGIECAGLDRRPYTLFTRHGIRVGFCAFAPNESTADLRDIPRAESLIAHVDSLCDVLIVSFHGGAEGVRHAHVRRRDEWFFGEYRGNVYAFAHAAVRAGADLVIGQGPHVPRALELYRDRLIAYSLGNFCTYGPFSFRGASGLVPLLDVTVDCEGRFRQGRLVAFKQEKPGGPVRDPSEAAIARIATLTRQDFPRTRLTIDADGTIRRRAALTPAARRTGS